MDARHPIPAEVGQLTDAVCGAAGRLGTSLKGGATIASLEAAKRAARHLRVWARSLEIKLGEQIRLRKAEEREAAKDAARRQEAA